MVGETFSVWHVIDVICYIKLKLKTTFHKFNIFPTLTTFPKVNIVTTLISSCIYEFQSKFYSDGRVDKYCASSCVDGYDSSSGANITCCIGDYCNNVTTDYIICQGCSYCPTYYYIDWSTKCSQCQVRFYNYVFVCFYFIH